MISFSHFFDESCHFEPEETELVEGTTDFGDEEVVSKVLRRIPEDQYLFS